MHLAHLQLLHTSVTIKAQINPIKYHDDKISSVSPFTYMEYTKAFKQRG